MATFTNLTPVISFAIYETIFEKTETRSVSKVVYEDLTNEKAKSDQDRLVDQAAGKVKKKKKKRLIFTNTVQTS